MRRDGSHRGEFRGWSVTPASRGVNAGASGRDEAVQGVRMVTPAGGFQANVLSSTAP